MLQAVQAGAPFGVARDRCLEGLDSRDRRLAYELAAGVLRRRAALDAALELSRADRRLHDILRLGAYQLRFLSRVPRHAAVSTSVDLARATGGEGAARYVNQALRRLAERGASGSGTRQGSHPEWLVQRWRRQFGAPDTERLITWNDRRRPLILQPARWSQDEIARQMREAGFSVTAAPFGSGLEIRAGTDASRGPLPTALPGYHEGGWIVQDPAHALVCHFAAIPSGNMVYDACAAPGGKAVILERLGARVLAGDERRERLERLAHTVRRSGTAVRLLGADVRAAPFVRASFDAVFVDAPCTATGTVARHPDARWRLRPGLVERAAARQRKLIAAAAALVRPGGLLIYATCSLEPEENEAVVDDLIATNPAFARAPQIGAVARELVTDAGDFRAYPHRHEIDGAYAARLVRSA